MKLIDDKRIEFRYLPSYLHAPHNLYGTIMIRAECGWKRAQTIKHPEPTTEDEWVERCKTLILVVKKHLKNCKKCNLEIPMYTHPVIQGGYKKYD